MVQSVPLSGQSVVGASSPDSFSSEDCHLLGLSVGRVGSFVPRGLVCAHEATPLVRDVFVLALAAP